MVKAFGCGKKSLSESDFGNCFGMRTKGFPVFRLFLDDGIIAQGQTMIPSSGNNLNKLHSQPGQAVLLFPDVTSSILLNVIDYVSLAYLMKQHGLNLASPT